jgi:hypothetical protein
LKYLTNIRAWRIAAVLLPVCRIYAPALADMPPPVQYANIAPLPGAGMALNEDGKVDGLGAMQVNIPIAYTPGADFIEVSAYAGEYIQSVSDENWNNGSGFYGMGFFGRPRTYVSAMAVSSVLRNDSKALSGQLQLVEETRRTPALALGVQDLLDKETKEYGDKFATGRAWYAVSTKGFTVGVRKVYATLGWGKARYLEHFFFGLSAPINDHFTLAVENDGYQYNAALGWRPAGRDSNVTMLVGYNQKAGPMFGTHVAGKASGLWAIPAMMLMIRH